MQWPQRTNPCLAARSRAKVAYTRSVRDDEVAFLARLAEEWKYPLAPEMTARVIEFCRLLLEWNARVNLTGARTVAEVVGEHVVDAFAMARLVPPGSSVVDVGAGGGLPGLAFAILRPDARLTMVEPRAKRVAFLRTAMRESQLVASTAVFRGRADALERGGFDVAASRATFPPEEWLSVGLGLVRPGGLVLVFSGDSWSPEHSSRRAVSELCYETASGRSRWIGAFCSTWNM
jgi:16S rRNA (guanine527-N7)-methyltransferase